SPIGTLAIDADGNLFGATQFGGEKDSGTVFKIARTQSGYASEPITLVNFSGLYGDHPATGLVADAAGNLFGAMGVNNDTTVFELSGAGFKTGGPAIAGSVAGQTIDDVSTIRPFANIKVTNFTARQVDT